jgi:excisionase family DNA binding protein
MHFNFSHKLLTEKRFVCKNNNLKENLITHKEIVKKSNTHRAGENIMSMTDTNEVVSIVTTEETTNKKVVSITEAAKLNNVTRQAIYVAIKQKKLKATKTTRWEIDVQDLEHYRTHKYSRSKSVYNGALLFDNEQGYYSINQIAKMLGVPAQKIYYATRVGLIKASRKGAAWVVHLDDVKQYQETYLDKRTTRHKAS